MIPTYAGHCPETAGSPGNDDATWRWGFWSLILLLVVSLFAVSASAGAGALLRFERRPALERDELSVLSMLQDRQGFIWFGTPTAGLFRYDGAQVRQFRAEVPGGLPHPRVTALYEDLDGHLWVGTQHGLVRFRAGAESFELVLPAGPRSPGSLNIKAILGDGRGGMWIATWGGVQHLDPHTRQFREYVNDPADPTSLAANDVNALAIDHNGGLFAGTWPGGVDYLAPGAKKFTHLRVDTELAPDPKRNIVRSMHIDGDNLWLGTEHGLLSWDTRLPWNTRRLASAPLARYTVLYGERDHTVWAGTLEHGLMRARGVDDKFEQFEYRAIDPYSLPANHISAVLRDRAGLLWVGTMANGVRVANLNSQGFERLLPFEHDCDSSSNAVQAMAPAPRGKLWLGNNRGVALFDPSDGKIDRCYNQAGKRGKRLASDIIYSLYQAPDGPLWIGTAAGLHRVDPTSGRVLVYRFGEVRRNFINTISAAGEGQLWLGTGSDVIRFDPRSGRYQAFAHDPQNAASRSANGTSVILQDRNGRAWMGSEFIGGGLDMFDPVTHTFRHFRHQPTDAASLPDDNVSALHQDARGRIWVGTGRGLAELVLLSDGSSYFRVQPSLSSVGDSKILAISSDLSGRLWLSTSAGLARLEPETGTVDLFTPSDGMTGGFATGAVLSAGRTLFFSGFKGLTAVIPDHVHRHVSRPEVALTEIHVDHRAVLEGEGSQGLVLLGPPTLPRKLVVSADSTVVSFGFAALHDLQPERNSVSYRLEGFDSAWTVAPASQRFATYTNLAPGQYRFRLRARHLAGGESKELSFPIVVLPELWQTGWFRMFALCLLLTAVGYLYRWRVRTLTSQRAQLRLQIAERTRDLEESNERLRSLSNTDALTGIANRRAFAAALEREWKRARRDGDVIALVLFDIDHFKRFNDHYGHPEGDRCLAEFARLLARQAQRAGDLVARYGGEEFVMLLPATGSTAALALANEVCRALAALCLPHELTLAGVVTVSGGVAVAKPAELGADPAQLVAAADRALYRAKRAARNCAVLDDDGNHPQQADDERLGGASPL